MSSRSSPVDVRHFYSATAQASSVIGLINELGRRDVVLAGYDVGSRVAQSVARMYPDLVKARVLSPPLPGAGWSGPRFALSDDELDRLVADYALPGAFTASIAWYRAGAGMVAQALTELPPERAIKVHAPTDVLWPQHDPLFPRTGPTD
jgi:pimeloyl-ACP methyl ester carboxylesterase